MKKNNILKVRKIVNIVSYIIILFSVFAIIKIDNETRMPEYINTDHYMNDLPYIYAIMFISIVNLAWDFISLGKRNKNLENN